MKRYIAIFDETGHDKKVKLSKDGKFNFKSSSFSVESFIGGTFFIKKEDERELRKRLKEFYLFCDKPKELKASKILRWNLENGAASIKSLQLKRYNKFLDIFEEYVEFLNLSFIWKKRQILDIIENKIILNKNYKNKMNSILVMQVDHILYNILDENITKYVIDNDFQGMLKAIKSKLKTNIEMYSKEEDQRSKDHYEAQKEFMKAIDFYNYRRNDRKYSEKFDYEGIQNGIIAILFEREVLSSEVEFIVDSYDDINKIFKKSFSNCKYLDSREEILLAIPDIFISFFGKLQSYIDQYIDKLEKLDKKVLGDSFFEVNEEQFNFMKRINAIFNEEGRHSHFSTYVDNGNPHVVLLFAYINYFSNFNNIEEYNEVEKSNHKENVNVIVLAKREQYVQERVQAETYY